MDFFVMVAVSLAVDSVVIYLVEITSVGMMNLSIAIRENSIVTIGKVTMSFVIPATVIVTLVVVIAVY